MVICTVLLPLVWWLHRFHELGRTHRVAALFCGRWTMPRQPAAAGAANGSHLVIACVGDRPAGVGAVRAAVEQPPNGTLQIWIDDSPSMFALERGGSRMELALQALNEPLADSRFSAITAHSLSTPGESLALGPLAVSERSAALRAWVRPRANRRCHHRPRSIRGTRTGWYPMVPPGPCTLGATGPISRLFSAGTASENVGITRLALRRDGSPGRTARLLVTVANGGQQAARRDLQISIAGRPLPLLPLHLEAGGEIHQVIELPAGPAAALRASISPPMPCPWMTLSN